MAQTLHHSIPRRNEGVMGKARGRVIATLLLAGGFGWAVNGAAQMPRATPPSPADSLSGSQIYMRECAPCHGYDGKGNGPVAGTLTARPPDLTALTTSNGGVFPKAGMAAFLAQRAVHPPSVHGTEEMQVWGPTFRSLDSTDPQVSVRIGAVLDYLESLQTEVTIVSGTLAHHRLTNDLFHIGDLWMHVQPNTEFSRWLSQGIDRPVAIILTPHADQFADVTGVRILTGTLIHDTQPTASPIVHELFLKDLTTGAFSAVTFQTTDLGLVNKFERFDNAEVSVIIQIK
jgi:mono/diheme cytochrome c family protein